MTYEPSFRPQLNPSDYITGQIQRSDLRKNPYLDYSSPSELFSYERRNPNLPCLPGKWCKLKLLSKTINAFSNGNGRRAALFDSSKLVPFL